MKKTLILTAFIIFYYVGGSLAQSTDKGTFMLGGTFEFMYVSPKADDLESANISFNIVPDFGYFVGRNIAIGLGMGYEYEEEKMGNENKDITNTVVIEPFGRYYVKLSDRFSFFGEARVGINIIGGKSISPDETIKYENTNALAANLSPGFAFFAGEKVAIEFMIKGISYYSVGDKDNGGYQVFNIGPDFFNPQLGIHFYF